MIFFRKSSHVVALLACSMAWGHAPRAEAHTAQIRLAKAADTQRPTVPMRLPPEFAAALQLYEQLEYEAALEQLARARSATADTEVRGLTWLYEGIILANLGHPSRAREAFREGLRLQPSSVLPIEVSPKIAQLFQNVRDEVQQEASAVKPPTSPSPELVAPLTSQPSQPKEPPSHSAEQHLAQQSNPSSVPPSPEQPQRKGVVNSPEPAPWVPTSPLKPEKSRFVKSQHVAFALGGILASTGIVLLATMGSAHPEDKSTHLLTGGIAVVGGLNLIAFGAITTMGQRGPQTVGPLQRRHASVGTRLSF